ncbi:AraC family transcriptional regulator [Alteromonas aestuariivivens]|uniref:AraC family transcriptional regulator n=2 Tax=Alteromonas aestuariivivens TaxID=1938339 RepID=A0A3D8MEE4_9ALTE|nr:AraC family transcriptional regulator [Alteromonas aestuariivivens]
MGALDGFTDLLDQMGVDPFALMARVDLLPAQSKDPDLMIPYLKVANLLEFTAQELNQPCIGARISRFQGLSSVGLLGAFMAQQPTIGLALSCAGRFAAMHAQGVELKLNRLTPEECELTTQLKINAHQQYPQLAFLSLGLLERIVAEMAGNLWRPHRVCLRQRLKPLACQALEEILGCKVESGCHSDSLVFASSLLETKPHQPADLLERIIKKQFQQSQMSQTDPRRLIRHAINVLLPTGDCSKESIAASLDMHPKKLERLLAKQGSTYRQLLDETRKGIALRTLESSTMPMLTLALNLGYADFSAFSRSFKRWTGLPPSAYLKIRQAPG